MCTAQDVVQVRCTPAFSCHVLVVYGALRDVTIGGSQLLPSPKGVTPAVAHSTLFLVLPARSCREVPSTSALRLSHSLGSRRPGVSTPFSRRHPPFESPNGDSTSQMVRSEASPSKWFEACVEKFATHNDGDAPPLRVSGRERERDQTLYLQPTCTYPGRRNLHERARQ